MAEGKVSIMSDMIFHEDHAVDAIVPTKRQSKRDSLTNSDQAEGDNTKQRTYKRAPTHKKERSGH